MRQQAGRASPVPVRVSERGPLLSYHKVYENKYRLIVHDSVHACRCVIITPHRFAKHSLGQARLDGILHDDLRQRVYLQRQVFANGPAAMIETTMGDRRVRGTSVRQRRSCARRRVTHAFFSSRRARLRSLPCPPRFSPSLDPSVRAT